MATALFLDAAVAAMPFFYNYCTFKLFFKISRLGSAANLSVVNFRPYVQKRGKGRGKKRRGICMRMERSMEGKDKI